MYVNANWPPDMNSVKAAAILLVLLGVKNIQVSIFMSFIKWWNVTKLIN